MFKHIQTNKENIIENRSIIKENRKDIRDNKVAIEDLKRNTVPVSVFESTQSKLDRIIHRLIVALILSLAILFISNAVWIYAWYKYDYVGSETTIITKDGVSNFIGNDGVIKEGE